MKSEELIVYKRRDFKANSSELKNLSELLAISCLGVNVKDIKEIKLSQELTKNQSPSITDFEALQVLTACLISL